MKSFLVVVLMLCAGNAIAQKRQYSYTAASARFFSDAEYRELIRSTAEEVAVEQGVPADVFNRRYPSYRVAVENRARPGIQKAFKWVEFSGESPVKAAVGSAAFVKEKALYTKQLQKAVVRVLDDYVWRGLFEFDRSDRIVLFKSTVYLRSDCTQRVVEEIAVYNGSGEQDGKSVGNEIKRGIIREIPTKYVTASGFQKVVPFRLVSIQRNGKAEPYIQRSQANGISLMIGNSGSFLPEGMHTYRIEYETAEQAGFFGTYDELYWNATGNGWSLKIDSAVCEMHFPEKARVIQQACFTGLQGQTDSACTSFLKNDAAIVFSTTKSLQPYEGLTVAAGIPKGVLLAPSRIAFFIDFFNDNLLIPIMGGVLLLVSGVNLFFWRQVGRDPKGKTIHPQFEPPAGLSPSEVGYIIKRAFKQYHAAAALVDAAVNKYITIEVSEDGTILKHQVYSIRRNNTANPQKTAYKSFGDESSLDSIGDIEKGAYNSALHSFSSAVESFLEERHLIDLDGKKKKNGLFARNAGRMVPGYLLIVGAVIGGFLYIGFTESAAPFMLLVAGLLFVLAIVVQSIFARIMGAYTPEGRALADSILGFKMYLEAAEKHVFDALTPPKKTLELFERYLPFAIALEVENSWAEQFKDVLDQAMIDGSARSSLYSGNMSSFTSYSSAFSGNLSSAISSASTPPGSSSGSGGSSGGGSSGGGGGGGGGGGW